MRSCSLRHHPETDLAEATGVVLAGGRSLRFGRDKLAEPYHGIPLLHHAVLRLAEVCDEVVVVVAPGGPAPSFPGEVRVRIARDAAEAEGPLGGALAGLLEVRTELAMLAGGDMPHLQPAVLREMLRAASEGPADAIALADDQGIRPLPAVVRSRLAIEVARALMESGRRRLRDLLDELHLEVVDAASWRVLDPEGRTLTDVDEPTDLAP